VIDFLGDSVFAVFGALHEDPEHAKHAVSCAVEMQTACIQRNKEKRGSGHPPMEMGIGINTGSCVVGNMGSSMRIKYGVVGHAVNLGARIESFTVGGQVLVSDGTRGIVKEDFTTTGPFEVWGKGVGEAIKIWDVRGSKSDASRQLPPLVPGLEELPEPVPVTYKRMEGKQIGSERYGAFLIKLAAAGAELKTDSEMEPFSSIEIGLESGQGKEVSIDGKVVGPGEETGQFIVRFSISDARQAEAIGGFLGK
jgi:adenylate cyclase